MNNLIRTVGDPYIEKVRCASEPEERYDYLIRFIKEMAVASSHLLSEELSRVDGEERDRRVVHLHKTKASAATEFADAIVGGLRFEDDAQAVRALISGVAAGLHTLALDQVLKATHAGGSA